ncbi:MAG TPA: hypothetical protein VEQ10_16695 [Vicinamibacteria bacterium]|nr:hypothetical protein [Vicinamibacteria bacterium]
MGDGFDLGLELVMDVRRRAEAAEHQCLDWPGGFTWWPGGVSQRVWAEPSFALEASPSWRVQVRSGFRTAFDGSPTHLSALTLDMTASALSAVVRDEDDRTRLELAATFHVHAGNLSWAGELVGFVAWLQAAEAKRLAGGQVGPGADDTLPADAGRGFPVPSPGWLDTPRWASGETSACVAQLASAPGVHAVSTPRGFAASFVLADQPGVGLALLEADTGAEWPGLGRGLSVALVAPGRAGVREALALNERETLLGWDTDLLGGWSARGEVLQHAAFFPDALHHEGLLTALVEDAVRRVDSVLRLGKPSA